MAKRWVQVFADGESIMLDVDFLLSGYGCAFGNGCEGSCNDPASGCCNHGAVMSWDEVDSVEDYVDLLTPEQWEHHGRKWLATDRRKWWWPKSWDPATRLTPDGHACIFSNSADFAGGAGCALHIAALQRGESHVGTKPFACWQFPLRFDWDDNSETYWLYGLDPEWWGTEKHWYCLNPDSNDVEAIAWANPNPVFHRYDEELRGVFSENDVPDAYESAVLPVLEKLYERAEKVTSGFVPVTIRVGNYD